MTLFFHELRQSKLALIIWSAAISFMLGVCIIIYPEMSAQMGELSEMFSDMGSFSDAFGMDQLNFGEFMGYFAIECGNTLGLGSALFAAIVGAGALAKEEKDHTAEFLLTHPIPRTRIISEKLAACFAQVFILNASAAALSCLCIAAVGVEADAGGIALLFLSNLIMGLEIATITFGISAFLHRGEIGIGLGVAFALYFINIIANLTDDLEFLKFVTPFGYTEGGRIVSEGTLEIKYIIAGIAISAIGIVAAYLKYTKKDIT